MPSVRPIPGKPGHFVDRSGNVVVLTEARDTARYDTVSQASGTITSGTVLTFFRDTASKNELDTNIPEAGKIVTGAERLILEAIGYSIQPLVYNAICTVDDVKAVLCSSYFELKLNKNVIADGPAEYFPAGLGLYGSTTENNKSIVTNGVPSMATVRPLKEQQIVTDHHTVKCTSTFQARDFATASTMATLTAETLVRIYCHGILESAATNN